MELEHLLEKLKDLSRMAWDNECELPIVDQWLAQFTGETAYTVDEERDEMLRLLTNFIYFGTREVRALVRCLYQEVFRYRLVESIRRTRSDTTDLGIIRRALRDELFRTRFIPIGNTSESSTHLLYYFRQESGLPKKLFENAPDIQDKNGSRDRFQSGGISRYVIVDDIAGSGDQALGFGRSVVEPMKSLSKDIKVFYYVLVATEMALEKLRNATLGNPSGAKLFDDVACIFELGDEFKAFSAQSLFYRDRSSEKAMNIAEMYGRRLRPRSPLGYKDGQLLIGFGHNVPDNTVPIFSWAGTPDKPWVSPFPRHPKS